MNIILMTVLLTLLGAGLVVLLVWLSVVSWKSIKYKKESVLTFKMLEDRLNELYKYIDDRFEELHRETLNSLYNTINENKQGLAVDIDKIYKSINTGDNNIYTEIEKNGMKIDSRFDKLYNTVKELSTELEKE